MISLIREDNFMELNIKTLPRLIDISCVRTDVTKKELEHMVQLAKKYRFVCCFAMPCFTEWLSDKLKDDRDIMTGGVVGFPSGAETTSTKIHIAKES